MYDNRLIIQLENHTYSHHISRYIQKRFSDTARIDPLQLKIATSGAGNNDITPSHVTTKYTQKKMAFDTGDSRHRF